MASERWSSPMEEAPAVVVESDEDQPKRVVFGPRIQFARQSMVKENIAQPNFTLPNTIVKKLLDIKLDKVVELTPTSRGAGGIPMSPAGNAKGCSDQSHASLMMKLDISFGRIAQLERERDEWKSRAESAAAGAGTFDDLLVEMELESLREEVTRLRALELVSKCGAGSANDDSASLRIKCAELEAQLESMKKDKSALERKHMDNRNAEIQKIRNLQEQVTNEKKLRERMANTESALQVVTVGGTPTGVKVMTIKPRSVTPAGSGSPVIPSVTVESANSSAVSKKPSPVAQAVQNIPVPTPPVTASPAVGTPVVSAVQDAGKISPFDAMAKTTVVLPVMSQATSLAPLVGGPVMMADIGDDAIADQWKDCLASKPAAWRAMLSRSGATNIFLFGTTRVACKKIGNIVMVQVGRETMRLEQFVESFGPKEAGDSCPSPRSKTPSSQTASLTMKGIKSAKAPTSTKLV